MKKALITGGAGYIGHHLQKELKKNGYYVIVLDKKSPEQMMTDEYCDHYIHADIRDYENMLYQIKLGEMFSDDLSFDVVFHLAGLIEVGESEVNPINYFETNVAGTINTLKLMRQYDCKNIVFSSSAGVYNSSGLELPTSVYGKAKLMAEKIIVASRSEGIESVCLRYFNVAGADPDGQFGENHDPETHLIPNIFNMDVFTIYGSDYDTPDGTCIRDYIHVTDLAIAHVKAAKYVNQQSGIFDIGSGIGYSVKEIILAVKEVTGKDINVVSGERRSGDPAVLKCDIRDASRLDFKPKYKLIDIIRTAHQWETIQRRKPKC
jgi:UDP-glucose 4-epimerase